jgi:hypothetical protein
VIFTLAALAGCAIMSASPSARTAITADVLFIDFSSVHGLCQRNITTTALGGSGSRDPGYWAIGLAAPSGFTGLPLTVPVILLVSPDLERLHPEVTHL